MSDYNYELIAHTCSIQEIPRVMKEQDAEIAMLKAEWHGEIERSKLYARGKDLVVEIRDAEIKLLKQLITELAAALQSWAGTPGVSKDNFAREHRKLIRQAREATKDE